MSKSIDTTITDNEIKVIEIMLRIYCKRNHLNQPTLCKECLDLINYTRNRISACPYLPDKPTCRECSVHCFKNEYRERIKAVMRYSGPRMIVYHPLIKLLHWIRELRNLGK